MSQQRQPPPISNILKKSPSAATGAIARSSNSVNNNNTVNSTGMVIHVSNRPATNNSGSTKKSNPHDFPALPSGKSKKNSSFNTNRALDEDMLPSDNNLAIGNVSAKHRTLVDDYVSVANPNTFQKLQLVQKEEQEAKARKAAAEMNAPKLTSQDFPSLGGGSSVISNSKTNAAASSWVKVPSEKRLREAENRKSKVAPAPVLTKQQNKPTSSNTTTATNNNVTAEKKEKKQKEKKHNSPPIESNSKPNIKSNKEKNNNNNENKPDNANSTLPQNDNDTNKTVNNSTMSTRPPPGFGTSNNGDNSNHIMKPPPGFQTNVTVNSVVKSPNNLTFTNSLGENYSIVPTHAYIQPPESITRNQVKNDLFKHILNDFLRILVIFNFIFKKLVGHFKETLDTPEALDEFRHISNKFREGVYKASAYYEHCQAALKDKFDQIFPELLALLPDISKQQVGIICI